jgi:uncharacterized protein (TIGR00730 family)
MNAQHNRPHKPEYPTITLEELNKEINERLNIIDEEFKAGFDVIKKYQKSVTVFGSARTLESESDYILARSLTKRIVEELPDYAVVTGGSLGIMEAANRGAHEGGGKSVGLNIKLPHEQSINEYLTDEMDFEYFFTRKVCLAFSAEAYIYFPGGFGTLDELFEMLTLIQTGKVEKRPVILVGKSYWNNLDKFIKENLLTGEKISEGDENLYKITDDEEEIIEIIKKAPIRFA